MYLKRLEIRGFKSFAEEIEIEFGRGITVIVGPNGCGKSNLTEAVQWVLGEQNPRALRGYKMDDFIFAGTSRRPPLGMAEVTLVFDNGKRCLPLPYEEVSITRRLYRSGESEYLINKRPCRLRQIQELLASCNIGRAAFSVVSQGMIDEFLSTKPEERRLYLEEAAGVARYRQRKSEALARLEEVEQALLRLDDILKELERQRLPLAKQAEIANRYKSYKNSLRELESQLIVGQLCRIKEKKNSLYMMYQEAAVASEESKRRVERLESEIEELANEIQRRKKRIGELEKLLSDAKKERDELSISKVRFEEKLSSLSRKKSELESRAEEFSEEHRQLMNELQVIEDAYANSLQTRLGIVREYEGLKKQKEEWEEKRETAEGLLKKCETEIFDALHRKTALSNKIHQLKSRKEVISRQLENLKERVDDGKRKMVYITQHLSEKEKLFGELNNALTSASKEREQVKACFEELQKKRDETEQLIRESLQKIERDKARLSALEEAERNKEGYERGVRVILQAVASGHLSSEEIIGLVEDLLVVEPKYDKALQAALGRANHYLVCTSPEAAQKAIEYLKAYGAGRASFLPLTAVERWLEHQSLPPTLRGEGIIGRASDLVACEFRYKCISEFLLGRTYFAEDLQSAKLFAENNHYKVRVVTLDGDMINPGGLITGGRAVEISHSLQRKKEIALLSKAISEQEKIIGALKSEGKQLAADIDAVKNKLDGINERCRQIESRRNILQHEIGSLKQELKQLNDFVEEFLIIKEDGGYRSSEAEQQLSQLQEEYNCVVKNEEMLLCQKINLEAEKKCYESKLQEIQQRLEDLKIELVKLDQQVKYLGDRKQ
ncbi:MAG: chromosome segregation protein SMC, partial [Thermacetogeniaceae bacterium]